MESAAKNGHLEAFKLFWAQAKEYLRIKGTNNVDDYLMMALDNGRSSLFGYLLSRETKQSMDKRIRRRNHLIGQTTREMYKFNADTDMSDMASTLEILIRYIAHHYKKDTSITPAQAIKCLLIEPFTMILRCTDMELARQYIECAPFNDIQLFDYCNNIFGSNSFYLYDNINNNQMWIKLDLERLRHKVNFLFELLELYGRQLKRTADRSPGRQEVLTDVGIMILDLYVVMKEFNEPQIASYITQGIFMNVRQTDRPHLVEFIHYFIGLGKTPKSKVLGLATICTFGTLEMVEIGHQLLDRPDGGLDGHSLVHDDLRMDYMLPASLDILKYLHDHNMYEGDEVDVLNHFASMAEPDILQAFFDNFTYDLFSPDEDDIMSKVYSIRDEIRYCLVDKDIDKSLAIQSIIQREINKAGLNMDFDIISERAQDLDPRQIKRLPIHALKYIRFKPTQDHSVEVVSYLLSQAQAAELDWELTFQIFTSACELGLMDSIRLLETSYPVFVDIRTDSELMSQLLSVAFAHGHYSICEYLIGCGARFTIWRAVGGLDVSILDTLIALQEPTIKEKQDTLKGACDQCNLPMIKIILSKWYQDIVINREKLSRDLICKTSDMKCLILDRVDVLAFILDLIENAHPEPSAVVTTHVTMAILRVFLLEKMVAQDICYAEQCIRYVMERMEQRTIDNFSHNVWTNYLRDRQEKTDKRVKRHQH
ncbi:hypothetical protein SAMD00019534_030280 [Acytostelium subglobosum LB1]|uniref:hypothetical protein n=1 Tax=Acytostelium subglobosum LB1 TaxID=1410327 RepID=UPI000644E9BC|nr:hypothetical protein SAMD00019534_030280 [Acytostelium subglobosum LB1]GAM19853.1 hypothetical protein SAMD00019534_030280 [Acytostelium subglobosum LB1]|eukprot:XP_012756615.1 hypothetical protein SAMD00019534_030280 [Acytostelium subglobosum LB1]